MKTIASLEVGQTGEILDRLKKQAIPAEIRTTTQESGLEMSEILVEDSYFDRGCDVVENVSVPAIVEYCLQKEKVSVPAIVEYCLDSQARG